MAPLTGSSFTSSFNRSDGAKLIFSESSSNFKWKSLFQQFSPTPGRPSKSQLKEISSEISNRASWHKNWKFFLFFLSMRDCWRWKINHIPVFRILFSKLFAEISLKTWFFLHFPQMNYFRKNYVLFGESKRNKFVTWSVSLIISKSFSYKWPTGAEL